MDPAPAPHAFFDLQHLLSYQNVLIVIAVWFVIQSLKRMFKAFFTTKAGQRLIVLLPMILCQAAVWTTVRWQPHSTLGEKVVLGFVLAFLTAHAHDVLKRFGLQKYVPVFGEQQTKNPAGENVTPDKEGYLCAECGQTHYNVAVPLDERGNPDANASAVFLCGAQVPPDVLEKIREKRAPRAHD